MQSVDEVGFVASAQKRERCSIVCVFQNRLLTVTHRDTMTGATFLSVPGGHVEAKETPVEAGVREVFEETGYQVKIIEASFFENEYLFKFAGKDIQCHTHWYAANLIDPEQRPHPGDPNVVSSSWLNLDALDQELNYHPIILQSVQALLPYFS